MERTADIIIDGHTVVASRPDVAGPWPGVVMLHEAWGIDDVLRRHAERLASAGYLVYAPDLLGARTSSAIIWDRVPLGNVRKLGFPIALSW